MTDDELAEVEQNLSVLIAEELETQHQLGAHSTPDGECPVCRAHAGHAEPRGPASRASPGLIYRLGG
jgi:hypothetical protein